MDNTQNLSSPQQYMLQSPSMGNMNKSDNDSPLINADVRSIVIITNNVFLGSIIGIFGIVANIINIIIFSRNGSTHSINVSLTALAFGDLGALLFLQWFNICVSPWFRDADLPFEPIEIQTLTGGFPHFYFTRVTGWITAFINVERCLGILVPLRVKMIITSRLALILNIGIYIAMLLTVIPIYCTTYFGWKFYPERNKTLLGVLYTDNVAEVQGVTFTITNSIMAAAFVIVIVCTITTTVRLNNRTKWWNNSSGQPRSDSGKISIKEKRLVKIIVSISIIYLVCSLPMVCFTSARALEPELNIIGRYANLNWFLASFVFLLQTINSSINIFIYYNMSSMYRCAFRKLFSKCYWRKKTRFRTMSLSKERTSVILLTTFNKGANDQQIRQQQDQQNDITNHYM